MIIVKVQGGLGNQMFQVALALALSTNHPVKLDPSNYQRDAKRKYLIREFFDVPFLTDAAPGESDAILGLHFRQKRILPRLFPHALTLQYPLVTDRFDFSFNRRILSSLHGDCYLDGYWQSERYFADLRPRVLESFRIRIPPDEKNADALERIRDCESVAVHVRRGDYLLPEQEAHHGVCSVGYYRRAIEEMMGCLSGPRFFFFSDDMPWVKENLRQEGAFYIDFNAGKEYEDMRLMSSCRHAIVANSSFSWWAAWLNTHDRKRVVAPRAWFNNRNVNARDVVPEGWARL